MAVLFLKNIINKTTGLPAEGVPDHGATLILSTKSLPTRYLDPTKPREVVRLVRDFVAKSKGNGLLLDVTVVNTKHAVALRAELSDIVGDDYSVEEREGQTLAGFILRPTPDLGIDPDDPQAQG